MSLLETNINKLLTILAKNSILDVGRNPGFPLSNKAGQNKFSTLMTCFEQNTKRYFFYR